MLTIPQALEDAAWAAAEGEVGAAALAPAALARAVVDRSKRYTSDREALAKPSDAKGDLAARATFFTVTDAMKILVPMGELARRTEIPATLKVMDLGAGCGAMTLGLLASTPAKLDVTIVDRDAAALRIAAGAIRAFGGDRVTVTVRAIDAGIAARELHDFDLIVAGTLLNELKGDFALAVVTRSLAAIRPTGAVIVLEPALRETSRRLHEIRDAVIAKGTGHVFAPCTRRSAPCPMLADERDWCHEDRTATLPRRTHELATQTGLRDSGLKFSYLVLRKEPLDLAPRADAFRVVSRPAPDKGKLEVHGCSEATGLVTLRRLRRHRADANRAFEKADRGDVLAIDSADVSTPGRVEITGDTTITST